MSTKFTEDCVAVLNTVMPRAEARAKAAGRALAATERAEIARLVRESLSGNGQALEALKVWTGTPASSPAKPAAPAVNEETNLGAALLEAAGHRSPFFETAPRTGSTIAEDAIPWPAPGISDVIARMPLITGDGSFHELIERTLARSTSFGGTRLG
jgi:hypothetical protein